MHILLLKSRYVYLYDNGFPLKFIIICHRPVTVKKAVIGSKGGWKVSTIFKL